MSTLGDVDALAAAIAAACRRLHALGLLAGAEGNLSLRLPDGTLLVTASGVDKGTLAPVDVLHVTPDGALLDSHGPRRASSEIGMHLALYAARPDIGAVVHAHPPVATALGTAGVPLSPSLLAELPAVIGPVALVPYARPGTPALATAMHPVMAGHDAFLLAHHGVTTVGAELDEALCRMESVEQAARILLATRLLGGSSELPADEVKALATLRRTREFPRIDDRTPDGASRVTLDAVRALVTERQRFDEWLASLEARREETPTRVYERVHADYLARRHAVLEQLASHVEALAADEASQDAQGRELEARLAVLEDERAEAMLRTAVGEFDDSRWDETRRAVEAQLESLGEERDGVRSALHEVRGLLAATREAADEIGVAATAAPVEEEAADSVDAASSSANDGWVPEPPAREAVELATEQEIDPMGDVSDETAFADAWLDAPMAEGPDTESISESISVPISEPISDGPTGESTVEEASPEPMMEHGDAAASGDAAGQEDDDQSAEFDAALSVFAEAESSPSLPYLEPPPVAADPSVTPASGTPYKAVSETFDDLAFLRSIMDPAAAAEPVDAQAADPKKTLKCSECQTMNYPTEWYCERCGGELVNL